MTRFAEEDLQHVHGVRRNLEDVARYPGVVISRSHALALAFAAPALPGQGDGFWEMRNSLDTARQEIAAAELNGAVYVAGGLNSQGQAIATVERLDPMTGDWAPVAPLPTTLHHFGMAAAEEKLYAVGGYVSSFVGVSTVHAYDPASNQWQPVASLPRPRGALAAVAIDDRIYAVGGVDPLRGVVGDLTVYDPGTNMWTELAPMKFAREHLAAAVLDGKLYVAGGRVGFGSELRSAEVYDPATKMWTPLPDMHATHGGSGAAALRGRFLVFGGEAPGGNESRVDEFDPVRGSWRLVQDLPVPVHGIYPVAIGDEVVVAGGATIPGFGATGIVQSFRYLPEGVESFGMSVPACAGPIYVGVTESPVVGSVTFGFLGSENGPPGAIGALALGTVRDPVGMPVLGVPVYVSLVGSTTVVPVVSDNLGGLVLPVTAPLPAHLLGITFYTQLVWLNTVGCPGSGPLSSSDSLEFTLR